MPYIKQERREEIHAELEDWTLDWAPNDAGDLNFVVSTFCANYLTEKGKRYEHINTLIGVLECAKMELYRVVAADYEDEKILENGKVYDFGVRIDEPPAMNDKEY